jgi:TetR/AcrR family transcriptional regulator, transcriptional repressor for nem operon
MRETKEHILRVSFGLFLQKSYKEVTMKEIVEKTGVSKGAFYHYFSSKEEIFLEIIHFAFDALLYVDFSKFDSRSLYAFYHDYIAYMGRTYASFQNQLDEDSSFDLNYYSLIFDAIRLFPEFKEKMLESTGTELAAWVNIIRAAKTGGEIKSSMDDEKIASIFMHINSGVGMNGIMTGKSENTTADLLALWDSLYSQIRT